jgi:hypothetical protein
VRAACAAQGLALACETDGGRGARRSVTACGGVWRVWRRAGRWWVATMRAAVGATVSVVMATTMRDVAWRVVVGAMRRAGSDVAGRDGGGGGVIGRLETGPAVVGATRPSSSMGRAGGCGDATGDGGGDATVVVDGTGGVVGGDAAGMVATTRRSWSMGTGARVSRRGARWWVRRVGRWERARGGVATRWAVVESTWRIVGGDAVDGAASAMPCVPGGANGARPPRPQRELLSSAMDAPANARTRAQAAQSGDRRAARGPSRDVMRGQSLTLAVTVPSVQLTVVFLRSLPLAS